MAGEKRLIVVQKAIQREKKISVTDLSRICNVTEETIRRDLDKLESDGVITRVHGGAIWNQNMQKDGINFYRRLNRHIKEKQIIAERISSLLLEKNTLIADSSTTVVEALKFVSNSAELTVVTNSTFIFHELCQSNINIISTGGEFNQKSLSLQGQSAKSNIYRYNVQLALISCKGLSIKKGIFDSNEEEAEIKKAMLSQAKEVALLVDHSKFDQVAFINLIDFQKVNYVITDRQPSDKWCNFLKDKNITLIY